MTRKITKIVYHGVRNVCSIIKSTQNVEEPFHSIKFPLALAYGIFPNFLRIKSIKSIAKTNTEATETAHSVVLFNTSLLLPA